MKQIIQEQNNSNKNEEDKSEIDKKNMQINQMKQVIKNFQKKETEKDTLNELTQEVEDKAA